MEPQHGTDRRAIPQRDTTWAARLAEAMYRARLTPNRVSVGSVIFAMIAAVALVWSAYADDGVRAGLLIIAAVCIPLRLLLNMLDGMLAVEKGMHTATGDLYNEVPDRIADAVVLAAAGYATAGVWTLTLSGSTGRAPDHLDVGVLLGFSAAILAVLTAYVRTLGAANGTGNFFAGPMAKPARMWVIVLASLVSLTEPLWATRGIILAVALSIIAVGSLLTVIIRLRLISQALHRSAGPESEETMLSRTQE